MKIDAVCIWWLIMCALSRADTGPNVLGQLAKNGVLEAQTSLSLSLFHTHTHTHK